MVNEEWKEVEGYERCYLISNCGRLKSLGREVISSVGKRYTIPTRILSPPKLNTGYYMAVLCHNGHNKYVLIHRLVAKAFIPNPDNLPQVNHIDGNKQNNCVDNLEWVSAQGNIVHAFDNNLMNPAHGIRINNGHFTEEDIKNIRRKASEGMSQRKIASEFCVTQSAIWLILKRKTYNWVEDES